MTIWVWSPWGHMWGSRRLSRPLVVADVKLEHRSARLEVRGRRIAGLAVPWGQRALVPEHGEEVFTSGAFGDDLKPVALTLEHGGAKIGEVQPANSDRGLEVDGTYSGDLQGRDKFSYRFLRPEGYKIARAQDRAFCGVGRARIRPAPDLPGCRDRAQTTGCSSFSCRRSSGWRKIRGVAQSASNGCRGSGR